MVNYIFCNEQEGKKANAYGIMFSHAKECLLKLSPSAAAENAGVLFDADKGEFTVVSLGIEVIIEYPSFSAKFKDTGEELYWAWHLIILHYLRDADGTSVKLNPITFKMLEGGFVRGRGYDAESSKKIAEELSILPIEQIKKACALAGAEILNASADVCARFWFLPRFPVTLQIWAADDEMDGSGQLLLDESASNYLTVEDAIAAGSIVLDALRSVYNGFA